ncbi:MAG: transposase [Thermoguttaceae bacterium]|nr:transposase [Thermoguttaceae bacterium]
MPITREQYKRIEPLLPRRRGNVQVDNQTFLNALLYMLENGSKWRSEPSSYGKWSTIYKRRDDRITNAVERFPPKGSPTAFSFSDVNDDIPRLPKAFQLAGALRKRLGACEVQFLSRKTRRLRLGARERPISPRTRTIADAPFFNVACSFSLTFSPKEVRIMSQL